MKNAKLLQAEIVSSEPVYMVEQCCMLNAADRTGMDLERQQVPNTGIATVSSEALQLDSDVTKLNGLIDEWLSYLKRSILVSDLAVHALSPNQTLDKPFESFLIKHNVYRLSHGTDTYKIFSCAKF